MQVLLVRSRGGVRVRKVDIHELFKNILLQLRIGDKNYNAADLCFDMELEMDLVVAKICCNLSCETV